MGKAGAWGVPGYWENPEGQITATDAKCLGAWAIAALAGAAAKVEISASASLGISQLAWVLGDT